MSEQWDILKSKISPGHLLTAKYWWQVLIYFPQSIPRVFWYIYAWEINLPWRRDYVFAFLCTAAMGFYLTDVVYYGLDENSGTWLPMATAVCMAAAFILSQLTLMFIGLTAMGLLYLAVDYPYPLVIVLLLWLVGAWAYRRYLSKDE